MDGLSPKTTPRRVDDLRQPDQHPRYHAVVRAVRVMSCAHEASICTHGHHLCINGKTISPLEHHAYLTHLSLASHSTPSLIACSTPSPSKHAIPGGFSANASDAASFAKEGGAATGGAPAGGDDTRQFWRTEYSAHEFSSVRRASERVILNLRWGVPSWGGV